MNAKTAYSLNTSASDAINDIKNQFGDFQHKLILIFASSEFNQDEICNNMCQTFPDTAIIGCSTAGEITSGKMLKNSVVAMGLTEALIEDINVQVLENIGSENNVEAVFEQFENHYHQKMNAMDISRYVGLIMIDGLSGAEEKIMDKIGDLTNITFIGGSAGDDLKFETTYVYANGKIYTDAAVMALLKPAGEFRTLKTQSFKCLDKQLAVTRANQSKREVLEFNHMPAVKAYAEAVGGTPDNVEDYFMINPLGLMVSGEPYVRSPQQVKGDGLIFYCNVLEGMNLSLLESTDIIKGTKEDLSATLNELGKMSAIINFHCILRTLELEKEKKTDAYGEIFKDIPTVGFSTYGEEYIGHINQTSTMLIFK